MRDLGIEGFRNSGIEGFRNSGIEGFRNSGIEGFRNLGIYEHSPDESGNLSSKAERNSYHIRNDGAQRHP
jgi:hypothetical protein